jgi:hypothetical protein
MAGSAHFVPRKTLDVDGHDAIPVRFRRVLDLRPKENARVVHEHVQLAVRGHGGGHGRPPVHLAGDVQVHVRGPAPRGLDLGLDLLPVLVENVPEHHRRTLTDEQPGLGGALPARTAADQRDLSGESGHVAPPPRRVFRPRRDV